MKKLVIGLLTLLIPGPVLGQTASIQEFCKTSEGKSVFLRIDVVRVQNVLNGVDTTNVLPGPEVSYRAKSGFRQVQSSSAEDFAEEMRIRNKDAFSTVRNWAKGTRVTIHKVTAEGDQIQYDITEEGGSKSRIRFKFEKRQEDYNLATVQEMFDFTFAETKEAVSGKTIEISLGMSLDDITKLKGAPKSKVNLGAKTVLTYDDMKLVFEDGKLADVQ